MNTLTATDVKHLARELGADLCGVAPVERFAGAPEGFHPRDVLPECRAVVVLGCGFLRNSVRAASTIPYTDVRNHLTRRMDDLAIRLCYALEARDVPALPVNAIGPTEWDARTGKSRGILSLKHAAELAGLGRIGRNTLLVNDRWGNMLWLSAVLVAAPLAGDAPAAYATCPDGCRACLDACPVGALDGVSMDQKKCWEYAFGTHHGGEWRIKCHTCRSVCPHCFGLGTTSQTGTMRKNMQPP